MSQRELLIRELDELPESLVQETLVFVRFLKSKHATDGLETALLSEANLAKDWLRPEEEAAWQDL